MRVTDPGQLNQWVEIESATMTADLFGAERPAWATLLSGWARIDTTGGREFYLAKQTNPELTHELAMWWQAGVDTGMRVKYYDSYESRNRFFDIRAILDPESTHEMVFLHCRELVGREVQS